MKRLACAFRRHPHAVDVREEGPVAEDVIAGIGRYLFSAWCPQCRRRVSWSVSSV